MKSLAFASLASLAVLFALPVAATPPPHDRAFWKAIAESEFKVPPGESAAALVDELTGLLGSPDPELRDGFAYSIPAQWAMSGALEPKDLTALVPKLTPNLQKGIGESGTDTVLLRSFSALNLSVLAAVDNEKSYLTPEAHAKLLDATLLYLASEKDLRGYDLKKGWMHATAHTADVLKFLARSPKLAAGDQARIVQGIEKRLATAGSVFTFGEDERLARALLSLTRRADFDEKPIVEWMGRVAAANKELWATPAIDPVRYAAVQNAKNVLKSLHLLLSTLKPENAAPLEPFKAKVLASVARL